MEGGTNDDMIQKRFGLDIPVFVILHEKLEDILSKAPDWWGTSDKDIYEEDLNLCDRLQEGEG